MSIFPEGYKVPKSPSKYMKLEFGQNMFRILGKAIVGYEYWVDVPVDGEHKAGRKPVREREYMDVPAEYRNSADRDKKPKPFMAFKVFNYADSMIQILQLSQKGMMRELEALDDDKNWGDIEGYDITINKVKTGGGQTDVEYSLRPNPKSPIDPDIQKLNEETYVNLDALWTGSDPFARDAITDKDIKDFENSLKK